MYPEEEKVLEVKRYVENAKKDPELIEKKWFGPKKHEITASEYEEKLAWKTRLRQDLDYKGVIDEGEDPDEIDKQDMTPWPKGPKWKDSPDYEPASFIQGDMGAFILNGRMDTARVDDDFFAEQFDEF